MPVLERQADPTFATPFWKLKALSAIVPPRLGCCKPLTTKVQLELSLISNRAEVIWMTQSRSRF